MKRFKFMSDIEVPYQHIHLLIQNTQQYDMIMSENVSILFNSLNVYLIHRLFSS